MARTARVKGRALPWVAQSRDDVVAAIARIGAIEARVCALKAEADAAARAAGEAYERAAAQPQAELEELRAGVQAWCEAHRAELCGRAKSAEFATGRVSWRLRPPRVTIRGLEAALAACRRLGLGRFLRERIEINREAMLADPEAARLVPGVTVASAGEDFVIEPAAIAPAAT